VYRGVLLDLYGTLVHDGDAGVCARVAAAAGVTADVVAADWAARVAAVVTSEDVRAYKPRPGPFLAGLAALGLRADELVHVGDSAAYDVAGAAALGIDTGFVDRSRRGLPAGGVATYRATSLTGLLPHLRA
jgi:FMN phosphatase YigB (HAD superfamily)